MTISRLSDITDQTPKEEIERFIIGVSPFTTKTPTLERLIEKFFKSNMETPITLSLRESVRDTRGRQQRIMFFMVWIGHRNNDKHLFGGTAYIDQEELAHGINLSKYEVEP